ncbi:MAG: hypothetical protein K0S32_1792 [Bacteroidetes bacterium]|nr:hypothetical protein [Bacteroidota bacterium]
MKRGTRFLAGFAAAALTFGTLMATLGPQRFGRHCYGGWRGHYGHYQSHDCNASSQSDCYKWQDHDNTDPAK